MNYRRLIRPVAVFLMAALVGLPVAVSASAVQEKPQRVRVGGDIKEPKKIKHVSPVYPEEAKAAGIQGIVILETIIGKDGSVTEAKILRGVQQLDRAALDAVMQWRYTPTLLNGEPVELVMTVTVTFTLAQ
jgi:periplasmic protein TonB